MVSVCFTPSGGGPTVCDNGTGEWSTDGVAQAQLDLVARTALPEDVPQKPSDDRSAKVWVLFGDRSTCERQEILKAIDNAGPEAVIEGKNTSFTSSSGAARTLCEFNQFVDWKIAELTGNTEVRANLLNQVGRYGQH